MIQKPSNKQTNTYWTCPSQGLNAVQRIAPRLISQAPTFVTIMAVNCRKNMQECFYNWTCFHVKGVLFVLYHLLSDLRILVDLRESNSYRSVSDVPFPQHNLIKNQLFTHDMNGTKKEKTRMKPVSTISFPFAVMGFTRQMSGRKASNPSGHVLWSVLPQTNLHAQFTFFIFREGGCFHYMLVIIEARVMKPKPLTLRPLSKAPTVFAPRSEAESLHRGPCFSFQSLVWLQSWGREHHKLSPEQLGIKDCFHVVKDRRDVFQSRHLGGTWNKHEWYPHPTPLGCWARRLVTWGRSESDPASQTLR